MNRLRSVTFVCAVALAGCGGTSEVPRGIVKGRVVLDGRTLSGATIVFENKVIGVSQTAALDDDGRYEFVAYNAVGLPAGSYQVSIISGQFLAPGDEIHRIEIPAKGVTPPAKKKPGTSIPDKYTKADKSGLTAEVKTGDNPAYDFELKS